MKKILLLNPPGKLTYTRDYFCSKVTKTHYAEHPIDLLILSGILSGRYSVHFIDSIVRRLDVARTRDLIREIGPDAIIFLSGTTSWTEDFPFMQEIRKLMPRTKLIGLGDIFREKKIFLENRWIDAILFDFTTDDILHYLAEDYGAIKNMAVRVSGDNVFLKNEKSSLEFTIPLPRHEMFLKHRYSFPFTRYNPFATVLTDYGCPFTCGFCIYGTLGFKLRKIDNVLAELDYIYSLKIRELFVKDQSFGVDKQRSIILCGEMAKKYNFSWTCFLRTNLVSRDLLLAMKAAGCHTIMFGIESANEKVIKKYKPGVTKENIKTAFQMCKELKIDTVGIFILGFPEDDKESCLETINFAVDLDCSFASFNLFVPKFDTPVRNEMIKEKRIKDEAQIMDQSGIASVYASNELSSRQLAALRKMAIRRFYYRPSYILKRLMRFHSLNELKILVRSGWELFWELFARK